MLHSDPPVAGQGTKFGTLELNSGALGVSGITRLARNIPYFAACVVITDEFIDG